MTTAADATSLFDDEPAAATGKLPDMPAELPPEVLAENAETDDNAATGDEPAPDQAPEEAREGESEESDDGEPAPPALDPPDLWTDEGKEAFKTASPDLQNYILNREKAQQAEITHRQQEAAEYRKQNAVIGQFADALGKEVERVSLTFKADWEGVTKEDWRELLKTNPDEYQRLMDLKEEQTEALATLQAREQQARDMSRQQWQAEQAETLFTDLPELRNPENLTKLVRFAESEGITMDELSGLSAKGFKLIHKLMKATQAKPMADPKPDPKPETPTIKPSIKTNGVKPPQPNQYTRFDKAPTRENAAALFS